MCPLHCLHRVLGGSNEQSLCCACGKSLRNCAQNVPAHTKDNLIPRTLTQNGYYSLFPYYQGLLCILEEVGEGTTSYLFGLKIPVSAVQFRSSAFPISGAYVAPSSSIKPRPASGYPGPPPSLVNSLRVKPN